MPINSIIRTIASVIFIVIMIPMVITTAHAKGHPHQTAVFRDVQVIDCHDGDTCTIDRPDLMSWPSSRVPVRLAWVDAPEIGKNARCPQEQQGAVAARMALLEFLGSGSVEFEFMKTEKYGRALGRLRVDGVDAAEMLISKGLARPYDGGKRQGWCE